MDDVYILMGSVRRQRYGVNARRPSTSTFQVGANPFDKATAMVVLIRTDNAGLQIMHNSEGLGLARSI